MSKSTHPPTPSGGAGQPPTASRDQATTGGPASTELTESAVPAAYRGCVQRKHIHRYPTRRCPEGGAPCPYRDDPPD
jgi:hypothetical protein